MLSFNLEEWIKRIFLDKLLANNILALNFGLFETENSFLIYCIGSSIYNSKNSDWACNEDYVPHEKYFDLNGRYANTSWNQFFIEISEELRILITKNSSIIPSSIKYITCGFDDGELMILWKKDQL